MTTKDHGDVFGFDIDQNGDDGVLATGRVTNTGGAHVDLETFDEDTGAITKSIAAQTGATTAFDVRAITKGDVALIERDVTPPGQFIAHRDYDLMSPVTGEKLTGSWTPPIAANLQIEQTAENQTTTTSVSFARELSNQLKPDIVVSDVAANHFLKVFHLDPNLFDPANDVLIGHYAAADEAVIALSPDAGAVGNPGAAPLNILINLKTGAQSQFMGFNNGEFGSGAVDGFAVDPNTGVAATATELNAQVEFYDLAKKAGITAAQIPCTNAESQFFNGVSVAVDTVNKLFLVTVPHFACLPSGSALLVYDESGKLMEVITGFNFVISEPPPVVNGTKRMGWTFGPGFDNLQQFFY